MDKLKNLKSEIDEKYKELENLELELKKVKGELNELDTKFDNLLYKEIFEENKDKFLSNHVHYKELHELHTSFNFYYDKFWIKNTYSKMWSRDSQGRLHSYEGPDKMAIITCTKCKLKCEYTYKSKDYQNDLESLNKDCKNEFDDLILYQIYNNERSEF